MNLADRLPPQNTEAEQGIFGSILLDQSVLHDIVPMLRADDFYRDSHTILWETIAGMYGRGERVDTILLAERLKQDGNLARIGGDEYIGECVMGVPHAANAKHYAGIVREHAIRRRVIESAHEALTRAYALDETAAELVDRSTRLFLDIGDDAQRGRGEVRPLTEGVRQALDAIDVRWQGESFGIETGLPKLDEMLCGLRPGSLTVIGARPGRGKSALVVNILTNAVIAQGVPVMMFSLEMAIGELAQRYLTSVGRVSAFAAQHPRTLNEAAFGKFRRQLDAIAAQGHDGRIFVDDTCGRTVTEIVAITRRTIARHQIGLVAVDYLQLCEAENGRESRQESVAKISRRLKTLARDCGIPVIALSQLNRTSEDRADQKPRLADLRECLTLDTTIYDAYSGAMRTVGDYVRQSHNLVGYSLDDREPGKPWRVHATIGEPFWSTGVQPVFRLRTAAGRVVRCSGNHPFRTLAGWKPLEDLRVGQRVAVPRFLPEPMRAHQSIGIHPDEARLIGYLISDGSYLKHRSVGYVKADPVLVDDVRRIASERFGVEAKDHACPGPSQQIELTARNCGPGGNPIIEWLKRIGMHGQMGHEKRIPSAITSARNEVVAEFLGALWAGDECVVKRKQGGWCLKFTSTSLALLAEIQMLLLRFGIIAAVGKPTRHTKSTRDIATISIHDSRQIVRFAEHITMPGIKGEKLRRAAEECRAPSENSHLDRLPHEVGVMVAEAKEQAGHSWATLGYRVQGKEMHPETLAWVAEKVDCDTLRAIAASQVMWDRIESIEPDGEAEVFDVRVPSLGNFVAGGVFVHNSGAIEQDADNVLLIHHPDPEHDDAEILVAKARNGPTGPVKVYFRRDQTRFEEWYPPAVPVNGHASGDNPF